MILTVLSPVLQKHCSAWPYVPPSCSLPYPLSHPVPHSSQLLLEQPPRSLQVALCCSLQEMLLLGLFWIPICLPGLLLSIQDSSLRTDCAPSSPPQPANPATSTEVKKHTQNHFLEHGKPKGKSQFGWGVLYRPHGWFPLWSINHGNGWWRAAFTWLSGWELDIQKATPRVFHPYPCLEQPIPAVQTGGRAIQDHSFPPSLSGALRKVSM